MVVAPGGDSRGFMTPTHHEHEMVARVRDALGERLVSMVSYGPSVHDDGPARLAQDYLLIVLRDLELDTLRMLADPVRWWLRKREPWPRIFTAELLEASTDVYPIEVLDLIQHRRVLFGTDPIEGLEIDRAHLRMQCERELREKLMRLREGYIEAHVQRRARDALYDLVAASYASFVRIFRACLFLIDAPIAHHDRDVVTALCTWLDLSPEPFLAAERVARDEWHEPPEAMLARYCHALAVIEARIDRMIINPRGRAP